MPLPTPYAYLVCYDLKQPPDRYQPLFDELKRSHQWWHYLTSTWVVLRYETLIEVGQKLRPLIFKGDSLLIMPAKGPAVGWLPGKAWEWLGNNVPNEW